MRFGTAFKKALKYHAVASLPTFIGGAIVAVALWIGLIEPAVASVGGATGGPQQLLQAVIAAPMNIPLLAGGVVGGLVVRRVGRTTLLFRIHGTGVINTVEREVVPDQTPAERSASDEQSGETGSAGGSSTTATSADETTPSTPTADGGRGVEADEKGVADGSEGADDGSEGADDEGTAASSVESGPRTER
ncbi:hypothetical protein [Halorubrum sp. N11]|uniref:hypothetical protein n=1 Tax=Halorubrum sp. N11 TaxID=3402276 RepID=UPI003EB8B349